MKTIGAILIIAGFLMGVVTGIRFSSRKIIISETGQVNHNKQFQVSLVGSLSVMMVLLGVSLFFCSE
jgi:hypothetical protein